MKNGLDEQYIDLLKDILENGVEKNTRNGKVLSVFSRSIRYKFKDGKFPLLTTKKMPFKTIVTELLWFLRGDTNIKYLVDNNCHIWDGDAYKKYLKWAGNDPLDMEQFIERIKTDSDFAGVYGQLGPIYGKQWRAFGGYNKVPSGWDHGSITSFKDVSKCDQLENLINDLKTNPDSRRLMVTAWNPGELYQMVLPPCHYGFQVYTRELSKEERYNWYKKNTHLIPDHTRSQSKEFEDKYVPKQAISLMYNCRSQDVPLGTPFNISSYALLLEIIGKMVNMVPDELITNMGDCHIYLNQVDGIKEQLTREPYPIPTLKHMKTDEFYKSLSEDLTLLTHLDNTDFVVENYQSHPTIKMPLSN
jgi:thymidylate synthase